MAPQTPGARIRALGYLVLTRARGRACRKAIRDAYHHPEGRIFVWAPYGQSGPLGL